ncbi:940_t:CDS:2, partial [Entrophospora sp. SA101]
LVNQDTLEKVKVLFKEGHRKKKAIREDELSIEEPLKNVSLKDRKSLIDGIIAQPNMKEENYMEK